MIESLLHLIRLAFATSALWTLDPSVVPSSSKALFIGTERTPTTLIFQNDENHVLVTCRTHVDHGRTTYDRCEVKP